MIMSASASKHFSTKPPVGPAMDETPAAQRRTSEGVASSAKIRTVTNATFS